MYFTFFENFIFLFTISAGFLTFFPESKVAELTKLQFTIWNLVKAFVFPYFKHILFTMLLLFHSPLLSTHPLSSRKIVKIIGIFPFPNCIESASQRKHQRKKIKNVLMHHCREMNKVFSRFEVVLTLHKLKIHHVIL